MMLIIKVAKNFVHRNAIFSDIFDITQILLPVNNKTTFTNLETMLLGQMTYNFEVSVQFPRIENNIRLQITKNECVGRTCS